jgi:hypothetical protein
MVREILSKRNFLDFESPDSAMNTGCLMKNASTHNFVIYYPISMNKKNQRYGFSSATKQS